jgi:transposase
MARTSMPQPDPLYVVIGVDTHKDLHLARAKDQVGRLLGELTVPAETAGYRKLRTWAHTFGTVDSWGIEGTGCYGAGLARYLRNHGEAVIEVIRPNRQERRHNGKSDPADADAAAMAVLSGDAKARPKAGDGSVEMIRALRVARTSAIKARTQSANVLQALVVTAPATLRESLQTISTINLVHTCARFRVAQPSDATSATKSALRSVAVRYQQLDAEINTLERELNRLIPNAAPELISRFGVGPETAGQVLVTAGDNPDRLGSDASFSMLCGSSPLDASSGKQKHHRLNRGGDRQANSALYHIVICRMRHDPRTKQYVAKRTGEGKTIKEIIRCLKRYVAREIYGVLKDMQAASAGTERLISPT